MDDCPFPLFWFHGSALSFLNLWSLLLYFWNLSNTSSNLLFFWLLTSPYYRLHEGSQRQDKRCKCHQRWSVSLGAPDPPNNKHTNGAGILWTPVILIIYSHRRGIANDGPLFPLYPSMNHLFRTIIMVFDLSWELATVCAEFWPGKSPWYSVVHRYIEPQLCTN